MQYFLNFIMQRSAHVIILLSVLLLSWVLVGYIHVCNFPAAMLNAVPTIIKHSVHYTQWHSNLSVLCREDFRLQDNIIN